jgi:hypothetical protein
VVKTLDHMDDINDLLSPQLTAESLSVRQVIRSLGIKTEKSDTIVDKKGKNDIEDLEKSK